MSITELAEVNGLYESSVRRSVHAILTILTPDERSIIINKMKSESRKNLIEYRKTRKPN